MERVSGGSAHQKRRGEIDIRLSLRCAILHLRSDGCHREEEKRETPLFILPHSAVTGLA